ncbi:hypothetical protein [Methylocystis parvus]
MAAEGAATRAIGRALGCATGTASKWRVRYPSLKTAQDRVVARRHANSLDRGAAGRAAKPSPFGVDGLAAALLPRR